MLNSSSERELITAWRGINASPLTGYHFFSGAWLRTGKYLRELDILDSSSEPKGKASLLGGGLRLILRQVITSSVGHGSGLANT